jgi:hypothetical protein
VVFALEFIGEGGLIVLTIKTSVSILLQALKVGLSLGLADVLHCCHHFKIEAVRYFPLRYTSLDLKSWSVAQFARQQDTLEMTHVVGHL